MFELSLDTSFDCEVIEFNILKIFDLVEGGNQMGEG